MHYQILGFDFGTKSIGVAIAQTVTKTANPLGSIKNDNNALNKIHKLVLIHQPKLLIVGLPLNMDNSHQETTAKAMDFAKNLQKKTGIQTKMQDERLTTKEARQFLFETRGFKSLKKDAVDAISACLILENYLSNQV